MQLEDKLVEDRDAALAEVQDREELEERGEDVLPAPVTEALHEASAELRNQLLGAIRMVLDGERLSVRDLRLPKRELSALESLQVAATGKSNDLHQFVYAEDRRDLLEQALAVLQPNLTRADELSARELHAQFADLTERVAELRAELSELEEAQDEREPFERTSREHGPTEPGDKPKPSDPDAPRPPTTLTGPEPAAAPKPPTSLTGPEPAAAPKPPTSLTGPDLPPEPELPSTLTGPELAEPPGPVKPPSSLGDPDELAANARLPWWRRPFG